MERDIYKLIQCSGKQFVSVSHRPEVADFHTTLLVLDPQTKSCSFSRLAPARQIPVGNEGASKQPSASSKGAAGKGMSTAAVVATSAGDDTDTVADVAEVRMVAVLELAAATCTIPASTASLLRSEGGVCQSAVKAE